MTTTSYNYSVTGNVATFSGSRELTEYYIDENIRDATILVVEGYTALGNNAFYGQANKLSSITLPDNLLTIGVGSFAYCELLTSIKIPHKVESIGAYAFYECEGLTSISIPDSVTSIGPEAFNGCTNLKTIFLTQTNQLGITVPKKEHYFHGTCVDILESNTLPSNM